MNVRFKFNSKLFSESLKSKRVVDKKNNVSISLGDASKITGVSKATLSRAENENPVDIETLAILSYWMGKPMESFFKPVRK